MEQDQLVKYYNSVDCLILTSFHEGSPNVIKEAMACNLPIVSTKVGDVEEIINKTGKWFKKSFCGCCGGSDAEAVADKYMPRMKAELKSNVRKNKEMSTMRSELNSVKTELNTMNNRV